jgi:hypothetical protein
MHTLQYAFAGDVAVYHTQSMTDEEVRERARWAPPGARVERYNRCPECQEWTGGPDHPDRLSGCPAVLAHVAGREARNGVRA